MSTVPSEADLDVVVPFEPARFSVEKYHELIACGAFAEDDPVELLEGIVVPKMPKNPAHDLSNRRSDRVISAAVAADWCVWNQAAITLSDSEPEPDLSVARGTLESYGDRHPSGRDLGLVAEVSDSSLIVDRQKARVYAKAEIPFYWIINLPERRVEAHSDPLPRKRPARYGKVIAYSEQESVPLVLDGIEVARIPVRDLLP